MSYRRSQAGMSIVQVMIAAAMLAGLAAAGSSYFALLSKSSRKLESSLDLSGIKARIIDSINCRETLASAPPPARHLVLRM
jgi:hypothetical protein